MRNHIFIPLVSFAIGPRKSSYLWKALFPVPHRSDVFHLKYESPPCCGAASTVIAVDMPYVVFILRLQLGNVFGRLPKSRPQLGGLKLVGGT